MIQFNLLPDIKQEFVRVTRLKRTVTIVAVIISLVLLLVFLLLLAFDGLQKKNLSDINHDIHTNEATLKNTPDLNKILTIQNQLNSLPAIESQGVVSSRLPGYISQIIPNLVTIGDVKVDFTQNTFTITGGAPSLDVINTLVDTLKFTTYSLDNSSSSTNAFSNVVLTSFGRSNTTASYTINCNFDAKLFSSANNVKLTVPNIITTRSEINQPTDIFQQSSKSGS